MGIVCGFYRMNNEMLDFLKGNPENAQVYIDENFSCVGGRYHFEEDIVFETDKAWDIINFLFKKCDPSQDKVLQKLDGAQIDAQGDWDGSRYIDFLSVKAIHKVFEQVSNEDLTKAYNQQELIVNEVYRADWFDESDWPYFLLHIDTMKRAFAKAASTGDNVVIHYH